MFRFAKMILIASMVLGIFAFVAVDDADAGYGWGSYRGYSYSAPSCYRPAYNNCNYYSSPTIYRTSNYGCYPSYRSSYYPSYNSCSFGGYGYGGYGGGYGGYGGYCVPTSYGQFNW